MDRISLFQMNMLLWMFDRDVVPEASATSTEIHVGIVVRVLQH